MISLRALGSLPAVILLSLRLNAAASSPAPEAPKPPAAPPEASAAKAAGLTFEQAVEEGMRNNLDLLAAKYDIPLAEADELTAGLWNNPSVTLDASDQPFRKGWDGTNTGGPRGYGMVFSYPLDLSGKIQAGKRSAHKATEIARIAFQDAARQKLRDIRLAYVDVMTIQQQLVLAQEKENSLLDMSKVIEARIGGAARLPLIRLRAQLARDQAVLDRRQKEITLRISRTFLAVILGRRQGAALEATTPLRDFKSPEPPPMGDLISQALQTRPDLQALRLSLEKAKLDRNLALAQRWDNFEITAGLAAAGPLAANPNEPESAPVPGANSWNAGIAIPLPLFNRNQGNIRRASLTAEQIRRQIASMELSISEEVAGIYDQLAVNRNLMLEYEANQLPNARKVRDEQQKLVGMGSNSLLDYFDALGAYTDAVSSYYDAVGEYRRNTARLNAVCAKEVLP